MVVGVLRRRRVFFFFAPSKGRPIRARIDDSAPPPPEKRTRRASCFLSPLFLPYFCSLVDLERARDRSSSRKARAHSIKARRREKVKRRKKERESNRASSGGGENEEASKKNKKRATSSCSSLPFRSLETAFSSLFLPQKVKEQPSSSSRDEERGRRVGTKCRIHRKELATVSPFFGRMSIGLSSSSKQKKNLKKKLLLPLFPSVWWPTTRIAGASKGFWKSCASAWRSL